jgi:hypothetical protein
LSVPGEGELKALSFKEGVERVTGGSVLEDGPVVSLMRGVP